MPNIPQVCHNTRFSLKVQAALASTPLGRTWLRANPHLSDSIWNRVALTHGPTDSVRYLHHNLTPRRISRAIQTLPLVDMDPYRKSLIAWDISSCLRAHPPNERLAKIALASDVPVFANAVLESLAVCLKTKLAACPLAYRASRLGWLTSTEADELDDDTVWELGNLPDTLEQGYKNTALGTELTSSELEMTAALLYLRPSLVDRAIAKGSARSLLAASAVRLTPDQQLAVIGQCSPLFTEQDKSNRHRLCPEAEHYLGQSERTSVLDPLGTIASMPWCIDEVWDTLAFEPTPSDPRLSFTRGNLLYRNDRLGYERHLPVRDRAKLKNGNWSGLSNDQLWEWVVHMRGDNKVAELFLTLDLLRTKGLPARVRQEARSFLKYQNTRIPTLLSRLPGAWGTESQRAAYSAYGVNPDTDEPRKPLRLNRSSVYLSESFSFGHNDLGLGCLASENLSPDQWELALALLSNSFSGTVQDLITTVQSVIPSEQYLA